MTEIINLVVLSLVAGGLLKNTLRINMSINIIINISQGKFFVYILFFNRFMLKNMAVGKIRKNADFPHSLRFYMLLDLRQGVFDIFDKVMHIFRSNGQANHFGSNPCGPFCLVGKLLMGGGGRVYYKAFRVRNICKLGEYFQAVDKFPCIGFRALNAYGEDGPCTLGQIFFS